MVLAVGFGLGCGGGPSAARAVTSGADAGSHPTPEPSQDAGWLATASIEAIWGSGPADVWAVGAGGLAAHFDGKAWTLAHVGTRAALLAVHGTGPHDAWAAADDGSVLHWDGSAWTTSTRSPYATLIGVWASTPSDVWACGTDNDYGAGYVLHWDGSAWQEADDASSATFWRLWSPGPGEVWLVGTNLQGGGEVVHGTGNVLTPVPFDGAPLRGVWGASTTSVWVGAYDGTLAHWDGASWTQAGTPGASAALLGMAGSAPDDGWAVGLGGAVNHYDGRSWSPVARPTTENLMGVWSLGPSDAWVAGGSTLLHWDGATWQAP